MTNDELAVIPPDQDEEKEQLKEALRRMAKILEEKNRTIHTLQDMILSLRNERAAMQQWARWVKGIVSAFDAPFDTPDLIGESVWKKPRPWRENQNGGEIHHPETTRKRTSSRNSAFFGDK